MGQFSWLTQDTNESIRCNVSGRKAKAYMHDDKGNVWEELNYEGYGMFGGKDFYELLAEMNGGDKVTEDPDKKREIGIDLFYSSSKYLSPNLIRNKKWTWIPEEPMSCPYQGWKG